MSAREQVEQLTKQQAANVAQKAIIDNVVVKFTRIIALTNTAIMQTESKGYERMTKAELIEVVRRQDVAIVGVYDTVRLTRDEVAAIRLQPEHTFPDETVQAIITDAVDKITHAILDA